MVVLRFGENRLSALSARAKKKTVSDRPKLQTDQADSIKSHLSVSLTLTGVCCFCARAATAGRVVCQMEEEAAAHKAKTLDSKTQVKGKNLQVCQSCSWWAEPQRRNLSQRTKAAGSILNAKRCTEDQYGAGLMNGRNKEIK